jgi:hypothetical protein
VQVEVPTNEMNSVHDIGEIPVTPNASPAGVGDVATINRIRSMGKRMISVLTPVLSVTAGLYKKDLGHATVDVQKALGFAWENAAWV